MDFCTRSACLLPGYSDLDCVVDEDLCLDLCRNRTENATQGCHTLSNFCSEHFCDIPGYSNLNCKQNEALCFDLCLNETNNNVTQDCIMLLKFCNTHFCDVNGYSQLDCVGGDNTSCLELCGDHMGNGSSSALRCDTILNFCNNNTCEALDLLTISELECAATHFELCLTICKNRTVNR